MIIYKSSKSKFNSIIIYGTIIFMLVVTFPVYLNNLLKDLVIVTVFNVLVILFLLWIALKTQYKIENKRLFWQSGPFNGNFQIEKILKIEYHKGIIVPTIWKPALSHIGLIITYNKYDDIYISPESEKEFIEEILKINPNVIITNNRK